MKSKSHEIDQGKFYNIGKWVMFTVGVMTLAGFLDGIGEFSGIELMKSLAFSIFYFASAGFFNFLKRTADAQAKTDADLEKMNEALKNIDLGGKK